MTFKQLWALLKDKPTLYTFAGMSMANRQSEISMSKSENIRRAERKEEEARALIREATYLRDLDRRLALLEYSKLVGTDK